MIFIGRGFCGRVTLAFLRNDMKQDWACLTVAHIFKDRQKMIEIMSIDRADIIKAELFKERPASQKGAGKFFCFAGFIKQRLGKFLGQLLRRFADIAIGAARDEACEIR